MGVQDDSQVLCLGQWLHEKAFIEVGRDISDLPVVEGVLEGTLQKPKREHQKMLKRLLRLGKDAQHLRVRARVSAFFLKKPKRLARHIQNTNI